MINKKGRTDIRNAARNVWDDIGSDIFESIKIEYELNPNISNTSAPILSSDEVSEIVLDAGRIESYLKENNEWSEGMDNMSHHEWMKLVKSAFPFDVYSL